MTDRTADCWTCGHPSLRPEGHADWCERVATSPAVATPDPSRGPAAAVDGPGIGAAGPRDTDDGSLGKCAVVNVGLSGGNRPAAPTTNKARPAATGRAKSNAAR